MNYSRSLVRDMVRDDMLAVCSLGAFWQSYRSRFAGLCLFVGGLPFCAVAGDVDVDIRHCPRPSMGLSKVAVERTSPQVEKCELQFVSIFIYIYQYLEQSIYSHCAIALIHSGRHQ